MRQDWIEFKMVGCSGIIAIRPEMISYYQGSNSGTIIYLDNENRTTIVTSEPYEQVKQKIMDAEKVDYSNMVEHFTREEYELLNDAVIEKLDRIARMEPFSKNDREYDRLQYKLNEILKEEE